MWSCNQQALQQQACNFAGASVGCKRAMVQRHRSGKRLQVVAVGWVREKTANFSICSSVPVQSCLLQTRKLNNEI